MICDSEAQDSDVALTSPEIARDETEARSFEVDLNPPEIARDNRDSRLIYTRESLLSLSEADICKELPAGVDSSIFRDLRVSYTREHLLSLAEVNACKELPLGFDQSSFSDLQDAFKSLPPIHEQQHHESVSADVFQGLSDKKYPERLLESFKPSTADHTYKSAPEKLKLEGVETLSAGRMYCGSTEEFTGRWDSFKLSNADSKTTVPEKFNWHHSRRQWENPTTTRVSRNASQVPEQSGILGTWTGTKPGGSELSTLKLPGSDSLLNRCSQPYRPPSFFKAMSHPETSKQDLHSNKMFEHAERPSKQRATEESWRKDSYELKTNEPHQAIDEKQKSSGGNGKVSPNSGACTLVEEHSALQVVDRFRVSPAILPSISALAELPCSTRGTADNCLTEDPVNDQPLLQEEEVTYHVEDLQPEIAEGGRFSALIILEDAEVVDPDLIDEKVLVGKVKKALQCSTEPIDLKAYIASNVKPRDDQRTIECNVGLSKTQKKGLRAQVNPLNKNTDNTTSNSFPNNTIKMDKSSTAKASVNSSVFVKPKSNTSISQGGFVTQHLKGIDIASNNLQKDSAKKTSKGDHSTTEAKVSNGSLSETWLSSHHTENQDITTDTRGSCKPVSESGHWISNNDKAPSNFLSWPDISRNNIWRTSTGVFTKENLLDTGQSREALFYAQEVSKVKEGSKFDPISRFDDEVDSSFEINLPDEDSLITIDDTCILQEQMFNRCSRIPLKGGRTISPVSRLNKPKHTNSRHRNVTVSDPWLHDTPLNLAKMFVNPSNTQADLRTPSHLQHPWRFYQHDYDLFPADVVSIGQLPLTPEIYAPSLRDNHSARFPQSHTFNTRIDNNFPADTPLYYQAPQMPWGQKKSDLLGSRSLNYQGDNINSTNMGMTRHHGAVETRPTFSQILQMQIEMAKTKLKLKPVAGFKQREYSKPINNSHR